MPAWIFICYNLNLLLFSLSTLDVEKNLFPLSFYLPPYMWTWLCPLRFLFSRLNFLCISSEISFSRSLPLVVSSSFSSVSCHPDCTIVLQMGKSQLRLVTGEWGRRSILHPTGSGPICAYQYSVCCSEMQLVEFLLQLEVKSSSLRNIFYWLKPSNLVLMCP